MPPTAPIKTDDIRPVGVALIGAGMIGQTHVQALNDLRETAVLRAVLSTRPARATHLADFYDGDGPVFTADLTDITQNPDIQMVIVATPPSVRTDLIQTLADAGKHILLEKPVARTVAEAEQVVQICERAGVTLGVLFQHRMRKASQAAARYIAAGNLGALGYVDISAPLWRAQSYYDELGRGTYERDGGGVMITQAIHTIDLALSLTGPVASVQAMTATSPFHKMESEDLAVAGLRFANGAVGSFMATTVAFPQAEEVITLHFEHASLRVGKFGLDVTWRDGRVEQEQDAPDTPDINDPAFTKHDWHRGVIEDFIDAITTGRPPIVTGRAALAAHRFINAIEVSSRNGTATQISTSV
ncbi:MAG: Gfo/Idh/MocA family protein [Octadecabacter sp.]